MVRPTAHEYYINDLTLACMSLVNISSIGGVFSGPFFIMSALTIFWNCPFFGVCSMAFGGKGGENF